MDSQTLRRILILVRPSFLSGSISTFIGAYLVVFALWSSFSDTALIKQGVVLFADKTSEIVNASSMTRVFSDVLTTSVFDKVFYSLAWATVGILAYAGFLILLKGLDPIKEVIDIHSEVNLNQKSAIFEIATKTAFRIFLAIIMLVYFIFLLQLIIPVGIGIVELAPSLDSFNGFLSIVIAFVLFFVSFQLLTVLLRLFAMRLRVFGGIFYEVM